MHGHHRDNGDHRDVTLPPASLHGGDGRRYTGRRLACTNGDTRRRPRPRNLLEGRERSHDLDDRHATRGMGRDRSVASPRRCSGLRCQFCSFTLMRRWTVRRFYMRAYQTILVPLDGSALAEQALAPAQMLARAMGSSLLLLSVMPVPHVGDLEHAVHIVHTMDTAGVAKKTEDPSILQRL